MTLPLSLFVNVLKEPNIRISEPAKRMFGTIRISGLTPGKKYMIYRFNDAKKWP